MPTLGTEQRFQCGDDTGKPRLARLSSKAGVRMITGYSYPGKGHQANAQDRTAVPGKMKNQLQIGHWHLSGCTLHFPGRCHPCCADCCACGSSLRRSCRFRCLAAALPSLTGRDVNHVSCGASYRYHSLQERLRAKSAVHPMLRQDWTPAQNGRAIPHSSPHPRA